MNEELFEYCDPLYPPLYLDPSSTNDAFLLELINSEALQRLKLIHQHGISSVVMWQNKPPVNRFEHSIGAMILTRKLGASVEEQAAALLHDVAHTTLSHVIDSVFGYSVHEEDKLEYLETTTILDIIKAYGYSPEHILNEENFSLLERDAPLLCADRVDYGVRDSVAFDIISVEQGAEFLNDLVDVEGEICFQSIPLALAFSQAYKNADELVWSAPEHCALYQFSANAIKLAQILKRDLWKYPCEEFWNEIIMKSTDPQVREMGNKVRGNIIAKPVDNDYVPQEGDEAMTITPKVRVVDPTVIHDGKKVILSQILSDWKKELETYKSTKRKTQKYLITYPLQ